MSSDPLSTNWPETWLRILLAGIPIPIPAFGSFLKAYEELIAAQQKEYIRQTLLDLENRLAKVERKEDFSAADAQIIITLLEKIRIEHNAEKRIRFSRILETAFVKECPLTFDEQRRFADATDRFTETHIALLKLLNESTDPIETKDLAGQLKLPLREEVLPALNMLCGDFGFVGRKWKFDGILKTKNLSPEGIGIGCECKISEFGKKYLSTVEFERK